MKRAQAHSRLVDMVVEEVSLVDRAANQRRFLIVKRSEPMIQNPQDERRGSLFASALSALEGLTEAVELLHAQGSDPPSLEGLAAELKGLASKLAGEEETEPAEENPGGEDTARAESEASSIDAIRATLTRVSELVDAASAPQAEATVSAPEATPGQPSQPTPSNEPGVAEQLSKLTKALGELSSSLKAHEQRISSVEKRFGLPNSSPNDERTKPPSPPEVGWPMDMNKPMDRESVDKSVSFHEV